jgi:stage V sporulation protein G
MSELPKLESKVKLYHSDRGNAEMLGFADVVIAGSFVIKGVRILRSKESGVPFISFPARKGTGEQEGKFFDIAHPITAEARAAVHDAVLAAYEKASQGQA